MIDALGTNFVYGTEAPFDNSYCHGPFSCSITDTTSLTITWTGTATVQQLEGLSIGVSGSYSHSSATANARTYAINLPAGSCGYFTFVPVRKDVWYVYPYLHPNSTDMNVLTLIPI